MLLKILVNLLKTYNQRLKSTSLSLGDLGERYIHKEH